MFRERDIAVEKLDHKEKASADWANLMSPRPMVEAEDLDA